jgi:glycosyltransferase involved in cell wall biosynthesis
MLIYREDFGMQGSPLVSIIIPTYNDGPIVCQAIDCALNQTYQNCQLIVVDDGSTDNTKEMLTQIYGDRIIYVRQENRGTGSARNTGIRIASGKYLQFLDADDLLEPDKISIQIDQLQTITDKALSYCDYAICDIDDSSVTYKRISSVLQKENPFEDIMMKWETDLSIPVHSFLFDMVFFKECGIAFDESLPSNEDWECWMNIFALDPTVVFIDKVLAYYRVRKDSRCRNRLEMRKGYVSAINRQIQKNRLNNEVLEKLKIRRNQIKFRYRDVGQLMRFMGKCPPIIKKIYCEFVPWRVQRMFD